LVRETIERNDAAPTTETDAKFTVEIKIVRAVEVVGAGETADTFAADLAIRADDAAVAAVGRVGQRIDTDIIARDFGRPTREAERVQANLTRPARIGIATTPPTLGT
jgi:hypothetical protein